MDPYAPLIERYLYESFPTTAAPTQAVRFEAIWRAVLGTKQRRFGPQPSPEQAVAVRKVLSESGDRVRFFAPWGASKETNGHGLDVLEVSALKQLACLGRELADYGVRAEFSFRLEDLTDRYLLPDYGREAQVGEYVANFRRLAALVLPGSDVRLESDIVRWTVFRDTADGFLGVFRDHLRGPSEATAAGLARIGWKGTIPQEQQEYYRNTYRGLGYPEHQYEMKIASYFAATLARAKTGATREPDGPYITVCFTHPVPGNPVGNPRVYYRTVPERYTHHHRSPWLAAGYLRINDEGDVSPRIWTAGEQVRLVENQIDWHGVRLECDYQIV